MVNLLELSVITAYCGMHAIGLSPLSANSESKIEESAPRAVRESMILLILKFQTSRLKSEKMSLSFKSANFWYLTSSSPKLL